MKSPKSYAVINPYSGAIIKHMPDYSGADVTEAITKLKPSHTAPSTLLKWHNLIIANRDALSQAVTLENGKPLKEAQTEVYYAASFVKWFAEYKVLGRLTSGPKHQFTVTHEPIGICALITPWNFPLAMITRKLAPALAAGNALLIKPGAETPISAQMLVEYAVEAGVSEESLAFITSSKENVKEVGKAICESPLVGKLSFTGSTAVGRQLMQDCSPTLKKLSLELGGNAPFVVFDGSTEYLERAVQNLLAAKMRNSGQTCIAPNRIYLQEGIAAEFLQILTQRLSFEYSGEAVGSGLDEKVKVGPLISKAGVDKVNKHMADALNKGASVVYDGNKIKLNDGGSGQLVAPMVIENCSGDMLVANEETFGPLFSVFKFKTEEEAIEKANDTEYGLAAYIMCPDTFHAQTRIVPRIQAGMVGLNTGAISFAQNPFGGVKQSGFGREGSYEGLSEYQNVKYTAIGL